jgi:asparagine synthetase B (glutamine-hydrolysing)
MSGLFGWWPSFPDRHPSVLRAMAATLAVDLRQRAFFDRVGPVQVGWLSSVAERDSARPPVTAASADGACALFLSGEIYAIRGPIGSGEAPHERRDWQLALIDELRRRGADALVALDGDFQLVFFDGSSRTALVASDRFASCPLYWGTSPTGTAFAHGVRGVLAAPGVACEPDVEALREAVTFGGYRLGDRTNIAAVKMLPVGTALTVTNDVAATRRYWSWSDVPLGSSSSTSTTDVIEQATLLWRRACKRRRAIAGRAGQTLSGGRDSRAVLGEAAVNQSPWAAITYGLPGSDDVRFGEYAARAAGASWTFVPLYRREPDWLELRTNQIQHTDGLIDLIDLMHLEPIDVITQSVDDLTVGTCGDFVCGTTYADVRDREQLLRAMPYSGAPVALDPGDAADRLFEASPRRPDAADPFLVVEHKYPQALFRPPAALAAHVRVRRPFLDLDLMSFWLGQPPSLRAPLYERWLATTYRRLFEHIPVQKTGAPVGAGAGRRNLARARRVGRRVARRVACRLGLALEPWSRAYTADEAQAAVPHVRRRLEDAILRPDSLACDLWGRDTIAGVLRAWLDQRQGPAQLIGALYVWERYHSGLSAHLRDAKQQVVH